MNRDKINILIVEDEAIIAMQLKSKLEKQGYLVYPPAFDGQSAINAALELCPDVILMDIRLPGKISGIDAAANINKEKRIPMIYVTGYKNSELEKIAKKTEPVAILNKPVKVGEIDSIITGFLS